MVVEYLCNIIHLFRRFQRVSTGNACNHTTGENALHSEICLCRLWANTIQIRLSKLSNSGMEMRQGDLLLIMLHFTNSSSQQLAMHSLPRPLFNLLSMHWSFHLLRQSRPFYALPVSVSRSPRRSQYYVPHQESRKTWQSQTRVRQVVWPLTLVRSSKQAVDPIAPIQNSPCCPNSALFKTRF